MSQLPALIQQPAKRLPLTRTALLCPACFWVGSLGSRLRGSGSWNDLPWAGLPAGSVLLSVATVSSLKALSSVWNASACA